MIKVSFIFAWYDLWVGLFYDRNKRWLYILPLPMVGIIIKFCPIPEGYKIYTVSGPNSLTFNVETPSCMLTDCKSWIKAYRTMQTWIKMREELIKKRKEDELTKD